MESISPIVKTIHAEMKRREWSVPELADKSGVRFSVIYRLYNGETDPQLETLEALLKALKLKLIVSRRRT